MPIQTDSLNRKLYNILHTRGYNPVPMDSDVNNAGKTVAPEEADVFRFTFKQKGKSIDDVWATIDGAENLTLYYDFDVADKAGTPTPNVEFDDSWYGLLNFLKKWAHSKQLSFKLEPKEKIDSDMAQRTYMKKKEKISEGYYPMGKQASYSDNIPTVKIVIQHTRQIQEGEQRYRNVARIFLENTQGEKILAPTTKPGIAHIYARHLAEGGVPNDERWNHIKSLCEEYNKMAGFVRAVRSNQFNESAQRLVEAGLNHYQNLRETLSKMRGQRGYNAYFESWTPTLMENEGEETNINELFVQETLDPRIESVMPILSRLKVNLGEMKEINELSEWTDSIIESAMDYDDDLEEGMGTKILAGAALIASLLGINQYQANQVYQNSPQLQALIRLHKEAKDAGDISKVKELEKRIRLQKDRLDLDKGEVVGKDGKPIEVKEQGMAEGSLNEGQYEMMMRNGQVKKFVAKDDADAKRIAAGHGAKSVIRLKGGVPAGKVAEQGVAEDLDANQKRVGQLGPTEKVGKKGPVGKLVGANESMEHDMEEGQMHNPMHEDSPVASAIIRRILMQRTDLLSKYGPELVGQAVDDVADFVGDVEEIGSSDVSGWVKQVEQHLKDSNVDEGLAGAALGGAAGAYLTRSPTGAMTGASIGSDIQDALGEGVAEAKADPTSTWVVYDGDKVKRFKTHEGAKAYAQQHGGKVASSAYYADKIQGKQGVAEGSEDLRAKLDLYNEKAFEAGHRHDDQAWRKYTKLAKQIADQLGLKYRVTGYGLEIIEQGVAEGLNEMDSEGYKGTRDDYENDKGKKQIHLGPEHIKKAKDVAKDAEKKLNKAMDKAHKKEVKEGQEDLNAILRIINR